jgi:hypothetical protein
LLLVIYGSVSHLTQDISYTCSLQHFTCKYGRMALKKNMREREKDRDRDRDREKERERARARERERENERERSRLFAISFMVPAAAAAAWLNQAKSRQYRQLAEFKQ